jgi:hypothetical protein
MKTKIFTTVFLLGIVLVVSSFDLPGAWERWETLNKYCIGVDRGAGLFGNDVETIQSKGAIIRGFEQRTIKGGISKHLQASEFLGKRVRLTAYMKTRNVRFWSSLNLDYRAGDKNLLYWLGDFKAMKGTKFWKKFEIVFDVPFDTSEITYGASLSGSGQVWFDVVKIEAVDKSVPITVKPKRFY